MSSTAKMSSTVIFFKLAKLIASYASLILGRLRIRLILRGMQINLVACFHVTMKKPMAAKRLTQRQTSQMKIIVGRLVSLSGRFLTEQRFPPKFYITIVSDFP